MKKILIPVGALFIAGFSYAQTTSPSTTENYVYSKTYLDYNGTNPTKTSETVQYFDGLGRPKQVVNVKASPLGRDVVNHIEYDGFGRQTKDFLPIPQSQTQNGAIIPTPLANASAVYGGEKIYAEKILENSPLDRIQQQIQVGTDWSTKPVKFSYDANIDGEVKKYVATFNYTNFESTISLSGSYGTAQLYKTTVTDEDENKTVEFKNGQGQILLVRKVISATENADTYYVYNDYNQLAYVIPPLASISSVVDDTLLNNLCYQYKYDGRNRLVEKKLPGKGWEYFVYDKTDRLILSQDANLKGQNKWQITKYDQFGRVSYTGFLVGGERAARQQEINNAVITESRNATGFTRNGMTVYYTDNYFIGEIPTILTVNYYDTYPNYNFNPAFPTDIFGLTLTDNPTVTGKSTKGLPVMSLVKNIEDDNWTKNYSYYDTRGRVVGTYSINHLGGYTKTESELDFAGVPQKVYTSHFRKSDEAGIRIKERFVYDAQNRLLQHYHQVDSKPEELLVQNEYNELSQLKSKKVGNNLESIDYAYNIRGWMTDINKDQMLLPDLGGKLFSYKIKYTQKEGIENPDSAQFSGKDVKARYNGNIAEVDWRAVESIGANPPSTPKRYGYAYDKLNRLTAGYYQNPNNPYSKENTESLAYDLNGNITNLYRTSVMENGIATKIDDLEYSYLGNQAIRIKDNSGNKSGYEGTQGWPIDYDLNGNMKNMRDKQIVGINYNYLNLPNSIAGGIDFNINHLYRSDGVKLHKRIIENNDGINGTIVNTIDTDYLDGFQYNHRETIGGSSPGGGGGTPVGEEELPAFAMSPLRKAMEIQAFSYDRPIGPIDPGIDPPIGGGGIIVDVKNPDLQFFPTSEGFYDYQKDQYIYQYLDHLGNVRISFARNIQSQSVEITDSNDYYPFGMNHLKTGNTFFGQGSYKNYKYSGKELQETGMYDYGARMYMADIGRWGVVDPLAETSRRWSPYNYAYNNPINFIDPDGRESTDWIKKDNKWTYDANITTVEQAKSAGADAFAKNGSYISNARKDGEGEYGILRLNEGGTIDNMEDNFLNNGVAALNSINGMVSGGLQWEHDISHLGNTGGDYYTGTGGNQLGGSSPFYRGDIDRLVNTGGVAGLINSLCIGQFDPKMERLDAILGVQIQGFGLADSVPGIIKDQKNQSFYGTIFTGVEANKIGDRTNGFKVTGETRFINNLSKGQYDSLINKNQSDSARYLRQMSQKSDSLLKTMISR